MRSYVLSAQSPELGKHSEHLGHECLVSFISSPPWMAGQLGGARAGVSPSEPGLIWAPPTRAETTHQVLSAAGCLKSLKTQSWGRGEAEHSSFSLAQPDPAAALRAPVTFLDYAESRWDRVVTQGQDGSSSTQRTNRSTEACYTWLHREHCAQGKSQPQRPQVM